MASVNGVEFTPDYLLAIYGQDGGKLPTEDRGDGMQLITYTTIADSIAHILGKRREDVPGTGWQDDILSELKNIFENNQIGTLQWLGGSDGIQSGWKLVKKSKS